MHEWLNNKLSHFIPLVIKNITYHHPWSAIPFSKHWDGKNISIKITSNRWTCCDRVEGLRILTNIYYLPSYVYMYIYYSAKRVLVYVHTHIHSFIQDDIINSSLICEAELHTLLKIKGSMYFVFNFYFVCYIYDTW